MVGTARCAFAHPTRCHAFAFSRRDASEFVHQFHPPRKKRAQGRPGAGWHPWSACNKRARSRPQVQPKTSGLPCAMVLRLIRALPGDQALLPPSSIDRSTDLTPALGRQDHTTSPSASRHSSRDAPRPSHPASNVRCDDREAPLLWRRDARMIVVICPTTQRQAPATDWHDGQFAHGAYALLVAAAARSSARHSGAREA